MKKILTAACMTVLLLVPAFGKGDWKGKVLDENGEPLPFVNVVLVSQTDSTVIAAATTDENGDYLIPTSSREGTIMVAMLGYRTQYMQPADGQTISLVPDVEMLGGATVSAVMPKTQLTGEGLQTNVRGSVLESLGTANDVLEKTPGLVKGRNGLEVIGKGAPLVYINGHKVTDSSELDRLLSNEIQSIEVISNPGAQYDATVNAVVRIRTIRRQGDGFGFNLGLKDEQSLRMRPCESASVNRLPFNDPSANLNLNYRKGDVDIFMGVNAYKVSSTQTSDLYQKNLGKLVYEQDGKLYNEYSSGNYAMNGGVNWQISQNHSVGFKLDWNHTLDAPMHQVINENLLLDGKVMDELVSVGNADNADKKNNTLSGNAYYNGRAGKLGIDLNCDVYTSHSNRLMETWEKGSSSGEGTITTRSDTDNSLYAAKLVLSYPVWTGQVQIGTEDSFSRRGDGYTITGAAIPSSGSKVREDIYAGFASYSCAIEKLGQISAGLRYEHVNYDYADEGGGNSFNRRYDNVFPSLSYAGVIGPVQAMLNVNMKTLRPSFGQLSDAIQYNSRYILQSGNAALQPQTQTSASATAVWKFLVAGVSYTRLDKMISVWSELYNDKGVLMVKPKNFDEPYRNMTVYLNATPTVGVWSMNYTVGVLPQWFKFSVKDAQDPSRMREINFNGALGFVQLFNTFRFKHGWQFELGSVYQSPGKTTNVILENHYLDISTAVQKAFLKDGSLVLRLEGKDLAGMGHYNIHTDFGMHIIRQTNIMDTQRVILSLRYNFNTAASKYKGTGAGSDTRSRM